MSAHAVPLLVVLVLGIVSGYAFAWVVGRLGR